MLVVDVVVVVTVAKNDERNHSIGMRKKLFISLVCVVVLVVVNIVVKVRVKVTGTAINAATTKTKLIANANARHCDEHPKHPFSDGFSGNCGAVVRRFACSNEAVHK